MSDTLKYLPRFTRFSLSEVLIMVITIGILAAVALPICNRYKQNARISEADANLSSIRTQLRIYSSRTGSYPKMNPAGYVINANWNAMSREQMTGKYFFDSSYTYYCTDGRTFTLTCSGGKQLPSDRTLNQSGILEGGS